MLRAQSHVSAVAFVSTFALTQARAMSIKLMFILLSDFGPSTGLHEEHLMLMIACQVADLASGLEGTAKVCDLEHVPMTLPFTSIRWTLASP